MQVFTYSEPDFDPYDDGQRRREPTPGPMGWSAPTASGPLDATVALPGSKSLTNRELVLAALADQPSTLRSPLRSRDTLLMIEALRALGVTIEADGTVVAGERQFGPDLVVVPRALTGSTSIECGLAGTVMRFLPPVAALALGPVAFDGDEAARRRPMRTTIDALRALGVDVGDDGTGRLPFTVFASGGVGGGELEIDASASSQFVSGLLLAAPLFRDGISLRHVGDRLPSQPHIDMTVAALRARGVTVDTPEPGRWVVHPGPIAGRDVAIEPDLSNAAPFLIAAIVAGGRVRVPNWPTETTQVGADLAELLTRFGAEVLHDGDALVVDGGAGVLGGARVPAVELDLTRGGELAPTLVALGAFADGPSRFTGIGHLRGHETDRLAALAENLEALGASVTVLDDGLEVVPGELQGGLWKAFDDHRIAQAGAIMGLAVPGVVVDDIDSTAKTLPEFADLWSRMTGAAASAPIDPLLIF